MLSRKDPNFLASFFSKKTFTLFYLLLWAQFCPQNQWKTVNAYIRAVKSQGQEEDFLNTDFNLVMKQQKKREAKQRRVDPSVRPPTKAKALPPLCAALQFFSIWRAHELWQFWPCSPLISSWQAKSSMVKHCCKIR